MKKIIARLTLKLCATEMKLLDSLDQNYFNDIRFLLIDYFKEVSMNKSIKIMNKINKKIDQIKKNDERRDLCKNTREVCIDILS